MTPLIIREQIYYNSKKNTEQFLQKSQEYIMVKDLLQKIISKGNEELQSILEKKILKNIIKDLIDYI